MQYDPFSCRRLPRITCRTLNFVVYLKASFGDPDEKGTTRQRLRAGLGVLLKVQGVDCSPWMGGP